MVDVQRGQDGTRQPRDISMCSKQARWRQGVANGIREKKWDKQKIQNNMAEMTSLWHDETGVDHVVFQPDVTCTSMNSDTSLNFPCEIRVRTH